MLCDWFPAAATPRFPSVILIKHIHLARRNKSHTVSETFLFGLMEFKESRRLLQRDLQQVVFAVDLRDRLLDWK